MLGTAIYEIKKYRKIYQIKSNTFDKKNQAKVVIAKLTTNHNNSDTKPYSTGQVFEIYKNKR